jgi:cytidylate kinase
VEREDRSVTRNPQPQTKDEQFVIAIDGPAGAGKSTIARLLARRLGVPYIDTGAMYRAVALLALRAGIAAPLDPSAADGVVRLLEKHAIDVSVGGTGTQVLIDGKNVMDDLRTPECSTMASAVSALSVVRNALVAIQRELGDRHGGVMEGRDIGSVVCSDARLKVFLTAAPDERARRRFRELSDGETKTSFADVRREQHERDRQDSSREDSPLQVASGAVVIDTTGMTPEMVVDRLFDELEKTVDKKLDSNLRDTVRSRNDVS